MNIEITPEEARSIISSLRKNDVLAEKLQIAVDELTNLNRQGFVVTGGKIGPYSTMGLAQHQLCWRTEEQAIAARALAELTQHYDNVPEEDIREIVEPPKCGGLSPKRTRCSIGTTYRSFEHHPVQSLIILDYSNYYQFLSFNNKAAAQKFLDSHRTLLEEAKCFLS